jgi:exopolysaccharide production protein ExoQ
MSFSLASIVCSIGIAGLFFLNRDRSIRTSKALWLPVIWLWIVGSRPVSFWMGVSQDQGLNQQLDGSPIDAFVFMILMALAIVVLIKRKNQTVSFLKVSLPVVVYFAYCLLSVLWSPYLSVAFKRWTKDVGDLVMVLIVVTEADPIAALRRLFSRVGFILLPASVLFIRYSDMGRGFDPDGNAMNTGVTPNKNTLGLVTFVLALGALWSFRMLFSAKSAPHRSRRLLAQGILLLFGISLLAMAQSATSIACFTLGALLIIATGFPLIRRRPIAVHALVFTILLVGGLTMLFGGEGSIVHAMGRNTNLTGRTDIWKAVIPLVPNPIIGAGFESFWIGPNLAKLWRTLSNWRDIQGLNTAHNGYIEVYLNLGWIGICLMAWIIIGGYRRAVAAFRRDPAIGSLMLAYVATATIYSVTEAGFRMLTPTWISLLLAVVAAGGTAAGLVCRRASEGAHRRARRPGNRSMTPEVVVTSPGGTLEAIGYGFSDLRN